MVIGSRNEWDKIMPKDLGKSNCPFCTIAEDEKILIIFKSNYWIVRHNKYPYLGIKEHLIVTPKNHKIYTSQLTKEEYGDYINIESFMKNYYKDSEYFSFIRQSKKGRSLEHLHYHYLPGYIGGPDVEYILEKNK